MNDSSWTFPGKWVLPATLLVFLVPVIVTEYVVLSFTHGVFSYPFDDTFIHLAIAKNIAFHGVWGISPHTFSSASSSVLYPLLLAGCMKFVGPATWLPLAINVVAGIVLLIAVRNWLAQQRLIPLSQLLILLALIWLTPLPALAVFGMEHTLQLLFDFLFIYRFATAWGEMQAPDDKVSRLPWDVYIYAFLVMATRYEGMFVIAMAGLLLLTAGRIPVVRRIALTTQLSLIAFLPVLIFGLYAMSKGSYFIPNSVLVKSMAPPLTPGGLIGFFTGDMFDRLYFYHPSIGGIAIQRLLILLPVSYLFFLGPLRLESAWRCILLLMTGVTLLHLLLASTSILYRYEAYLIGCSIPIFGVLVARYGWDMLKGPYASASWIAVAILMIMGIPMIMRGRAAASLMQQGSINIFEQQYQMAQFVHRYYNETPVAMGDIGAISFFSSGNNLDLEGLGNLAVARSRKDHYWTPDFLSAECKKDSVRIAIVFDRSYPAELRSRWFKVAIWQIPNNIACYSDVVSFYAADSADGPWLEANLRAFQSALPPDVVVRYNPTSTASPPKPIIAE